jgi:hypothetical protein
LPQISHVDATAVLLLALLLISFQWEQGVRVPRRQGRKPITAERGASVGVS